MILSYRFCVDDPYDDNQDRVNISRIFHSVLVGSIDYHTMETSQDYSVITTEITEDYQVFKQELTNNGEETTMIGETDSNSTNKLDKEREPLVR